MRPIQPYRRRSSASFWLGLALILLMASGGVVGLLLLLGVNLNPFAVPREDPFMVRIPINSQPIPAYQRVAREHLLNPATGGLMHQRIPPNATVGMSITGITADGSHVESRIERVRNVNDQVVFVVTDGREVPHGQVHELGDALMNVNAIIGRVVKKDKRPGMGFREDTFFRQGTPEGIAGATPPGMRAVTLDATKLTGVHALNAGDQIDLMASVPVAERASFRTHSNSRLPAAALVASASPGQRDSATEPMLLAQGAVVLKPVYVRNEATTSASLTQGKRVQNVPKYEVAIAVAPDDVIPLQSALNKSLAITCITHSMQPGTGDFEPPTVATVDGQRLVPVTVRAILAYDVVIREAFVSPATRRMRVESVSQQEIDRQGIITSLDEALGAVARYDIPSGRFLRKSDLLSGSLRSRPPAPDKSSAKVAARSTRVAVRSANRTPVPTKLAVYDKRENGEVFVSQADVDDVPFAEQAATIGDRPAITRFIPPGYTAFAIPWNRLYGSEHLRIGDELDLLASFSLESEDEEEETETRPDGTKVVRKRHDIATRGTLRTWDESLGFRGEPWFVASDALVVGPVGFPAPASAQRALGNSLNRASSGSGETAFSGSPLIIAVDDRDVESVVAALATRRVLFTPAFHPSLEGGFSADGVKRIAIAAQDIAPYERFTETVWNGNRRRPVSREVTQDDARFANALTIAEMERFEYRVLRGAKRRGEYFTAADFLPVGAEPGVAAAAGRGATIVAVADREIEGLESFQSDDRVAILIRGVVKAPQGVIAHGVDLERPVSSVIVPSVRIVRASRRGQTVLEVANEDLTRLQAAWAASMSRDNAARGADKRSHLLAVALPRRVEEQDPAGGIDADRSASTGPWRVIPEFAARPIRHGNEWLMALDRAGEEPGRASEAAIPAFDAIGGLKVMEAIVGRRLELHAFPAAAPAASVPHPSQSFNLARD